MRSQNIDILTMFLCENIYRSYFKCQFRCDVTPWRYAKENIIRSILLLLLLCSPFLSAGALGALDLSVGAALHARSRLLCCLASCSMVSSRWVRCSRSYCSARCHLLLWVSARSRKSRQAWGNTSTQMLSFALTCSPVQHMFSICDVDPLNKNRERVEFISSFLHCLRDWHKIWFHFQAWHGCCSLLFRENTFCCPEKFGFSSFYSKYSVNKVNRVSDELRFHADCMAEDFWVKRGRHYSCCASDCWAKEVTSDHTETTCQHLLALHHMRDVPTTQ